MWAFLHPALEGMLLLQEGLHRSMTVEIFCLCQWALTDLKAFSINLETSLQEWFRSDQREFKSFLMLLKVLNH